MDGGAGAVEVFIGNKGVQFAASLNTSEENLCIILKPDIVKYKDEVMFKYPDFISYKGVPTNEKELVEFAEKNNVTADIKDIVRPNGLPMAHLLKKVNESKPFSADNMCPVKEIDIESEFLG